MLVAKKLIQKAVHHHHHHPQVNVEDGGLTAADLDLQVDVHYGIPSTASLLAFDPVQRLLAIATLDGRIKVIGGDGIEGLFISPKQLPYKYLEFIRNRGFLVGILNDNDIQVWELESRLLACTFQWESNITAFSVISGSCFMYIGDEYGSMSVLKYDSEDARLLQFPYHISANSFKEAVGFPSLDDQPIVGILPQPCSFGNRVLIAYENGLIILWDASEAQTHFVGGGKDLQLKDHIVDSGSVNVNVPENIYDQVLDKEISALCWASSSGSIAAVGYIDGDIFFWKTSTASSSRDPKNELSSNNVVKLQLSSAERRLPVIVLHWLPSDKPSNDGDGRLFIYGGDEIGSEEVLTVLTIEWTSKMATLRCSGRVDLTLTGSFADMILLPNVGPSGGNHKAVLSVLTNPGQLHLYECSSLSSLLSQQEIRSNGFAVQFPSVVPTAAPFMTVATLTTLPSGGNSSKILSKIASINKQFSIPSLPGGTTWPVTGGVSCQLTSTGHTVVERVYIAGYQDGSIRLWDASYPVLSLICTIEGEVRIYNLNVSMDDASFHLITETEHEIHALPQGKVPQCRAVFSLVSSPILALKFTNSGTKLAVGFECGRIAALDMNSLSVLFFKDCVSGSSSPVISVTPIEYANTSSHVQGPEHSEKNMVIKPEEEIMFFLTKDATVSIIDGVSGSMTNSNAWQPKKKLKALSMYIIEGTASSFGLTEGKQVKEVDQDIAGNSKPMHKPALTISSHNSASHLASGIASTRERLLDSFILLCCEDSLRLYSVNNVIQGNNKTIHKVKHAGPCCWSAPFRKDEKLCGIILLFQTGLVEIRSFPGLQSVKEISLMSILRWNFKANMEKTMCSDDRKIALVNGCELAFVSLLSSENYSRIPEFFPALHDKVVAAAADAALSFSLNQMKKQGVKLGLLGGIVKGFKGGKINHGPDASPRPDFTHLEDIFSKTPFSDPSPTVAESQEVGELNIDDIQIDVPPPTRLVTASQQVKDVKREKGTEREQLLGVADDMKPRMRTPEEIMAAYRKTGDASSAAAHARNKLVERQEKLERISRRTAELQSGAEDFSFMANELVKVLENRKWWQI